jgi:hypothetical protein
VKVVADQTSANAFLIDAQKKFFSYADTDIVQINQDSNNPDIQNEDALKTSLFKMMFEH